MPFFLSFYYGQNVFCTFTSEIKDYYYYLLVFVFVVTATSGSVLAVVSISLCYESLAFIYCASFY